MFKFSLTNLVILGKTGLTMYKISLNSGEIKHACMSLEDISKPEHKYSFTYKLWVWDPIVVKTE